MHDSGLGLPRADQPAGAQIVLALVLWPPQPQRLQGGPLQTPYFLGHLPVDLQHLTYPLQLWAGAEQPAQD